MVRLRKFTLLALVVPLALSLTNCGPQNAAKPRETTFNDDTFAASPEPEAEPFLSGQRDFTRLSPIQAPAVVLERLKENRKGKEDSGDCEPYETTETPFRIRQPKLVIDVDTQSMSFELQVQSPKRGTESIKLKGSFDRSTSPWRADLYAVDETLLKEKRVQAVAMCVTANVCDVLGIDIYYVIEGKRYCRQLQSGVAGPRLAMSGDELVEQADNQPTEEAKIQGGAPATATDFAWDPSMGYGHTDQLKRPDSKPEGATVVRPAAPVAVAAGDSDDYDESEDYDEPVRPMTPATPTARRAAAPVTGTPVTPKPALEAKKSIGERQPPAAVPTPNSAAPAPAINPIDTARAATAKPPERMSRPERVLTKPPPQVADLTPQQLEERVIEVNGRINIGRPKPNPNNIEGMPVPNANDDTGTKKTQAIGFHSRGSLRNADYLPPVGVGFMRSAVSPDITADRDSSSAWGAARTIEFIEWLGQDAEKRNPGTTLVINSIARRYGGLRPGAATCYIDKRTGKKICVGSHQNGLDIDIRYLTKDGNTGKFRAASRGEISPNFDFSKNWETAKSITRFGQGRANWILVMFMDRQIKANLCRYAKQAGETINEPGSLAFETLRHITHEDGHTSHFHVRLYCPETQGCGNSIVTLPRGNGCQ